MLELILSKRLASDDWIFPNDLFENKYLGERAKQDCVWNDDNAKVTHDKFHAIARKYNYSIHRMNDDGATEQLVWKF